MTKDELLKALQKNYDAATNLQLWSCASLINQAIFAVEQEEQQNCLIKELQDNKDEKPLLDQFDFCDFCD